MINIKLTYINNDYCSNTQIKFMKNQKLYRLDKPNQMYKTFYGESSHEEYFIYKNDGGNDILHSTKGPAHWCVNCNWYGYFLMNKSYTKEEWEKLVKEMEYSNDAI